MRKTELKPNSHGEFVRQLGWRITESGTPTHAKFRLGKNRRDAEQRLSKLEMLWQSIESNSGPNKAHWDDSAWPIAKAIEKGSSSISIPRLTESRRGGWFAPPTGACFERDDDYARRLQEFQTKYPFLIFIPEDGEAFQRGVQLKVELANANLDRLDSEAQGHRQTLSKFGQPTRLVGQTLHQAIDAYIQWVRKDYLQDENFVSPNGMAKIRMMKTVRRICGDVDIGSLGYDAVEGLFRILRKRPIAKRSGEKMKPKTAKNIVGELGRFFRWLHRSEEFNWQKPDDFAEINKKVEIAPDEVKVRQVKTYSIDELGLLYEYATPMDRVFLLLALNCGFGVAEMARLRVEEVIVSPNADGAIESNALIRIVRPKSGVPGEWNLWPHTAKLLAWTLERRKSQLKYEPAARLLLNENGEPYDKLTKGNNRNQQIPNAWDRLSSRIQEDHPTFPRLSFGKLRKTTGNLVRSVASDEVASLFLCHGKPVNDDDLLDAYTNRPFPRVQEALLSLGSILGPMFERVGDPTEAPKKNYLSRQKVMQIKRLRSQGRSVEQIAKQIGVSKMTVYRHTTSS